MKRKAFVLVPILVCFVMLAFTSSAFAWTHTGEVTKIEKWASGTIFVEVTSSTPTVVKKALSGTLSADHQKELLAMFLTAQANGNEVTIYIVDGKIVSLTIP